MGATSPAGLLRAIHQLCSALDLSIAGINGEKSSSSGLAELAQTLYGAAAKKILAACQLRIERVRPCCPSDLLVDPPEDRERMREGNGVLYQYL